MIVFFLGRQPEISLAELTAVFCQTPRLITNQIATLDIDTQLALAAAPRLGSIVKVAEVVADDFQLDQTNVDKLVEQLFGTVEGKVTLGLSIYNQAIAKRDATSFRFTIRDAIKTLGHSVRLVPADGPILATAVTMHNKLAHNNPKKVELNFIKLESHYLVAKTIYVQDITSYTWRDRGRPQRDAHNGMLPPKLAQIMINLGISACNLDNDKLRLLDPFCGTGVVLQEASLMGLPVYGTDINRNMVDNTRTNLSWLSDQHHVPANFELVTADATNFDWQSWTMPHQINLVVSETYLGRPYIKSPTYSELQANIANCNTIINKFIANIARQLPIGAGLCLAVPAWFTGHDRINHLPCLADIERHNLVNQTSGANLIYHRPGQIVGRELLVLQKR